MADVFVSKDQLSRALKTANQLYRYLEDRGYRVTLCELSRAYFRADLDHREQPTAGHWWNQERWSPDRPTIVFVGTVAIGLTLYELSKYLEVRKGSPGGYEWTHRENVPSGRLVLRAYSPYEGVEWGKQWRETRSGSLHQQFGEIVKELEDASPIVVKLVEEERRRTEEARQRAEAEHREWRRQEVERRRAQADKESRQQLLAIVEAWVTACNIESFFESAAEASSELPTQEHAAVAARLGRAHGMFGGISALDHFRAWRSPEER